MPRVAVVLPAHNEQLTVEATIRAFHAALPKAEIYVVDNASSDRTGQVATDALAQLACAGGVIAEPRRGKGCAVRRAFLEIDADIYVLADADATYPAEKVGDLIAPILHQQADMVVGDRHSGGHYDRENDRWLHGMGNRLVRWLVNTLFHANLTDIMSGYRAFSRVFVKNYPIIVDGFEIETDMTLHALHKRFRITEISVAYFSRPPGSTSKLNTLSDGAKVIFAIFQILRYYRPLLFFGTLAALAGVAGLLAAVPVFQDWISEHYVYHVPLAILAAALEIVAVMTLCVGLVLDSIAHQDRRNYERNLLTQSQSRNAAAEAPR